MAILHLHFYLPINDSYSLDDLVNYFRGRVGQIDPTKEREPKPDRFDDAGVYLDFRSNKATGTAPRWCRRLPGALGAGF